MGSVVQTAKRQSLRQAREAIEAWRQQSDKFEELCSKVDSPELLTALYDTLHEHMHGAASEVDGRGWRRAVDKGRQLADQHFAGRCDLAAQYVWWMLREKSKRRNKQRVSWALLCSASMLTDFRVALAKQGAQLPGPAEGDPVPANDGLWLERGDHVELAELLVEQLQEQAPVVHTDGAFYDYDATAGLWRPIDSGKLSRTVQGFAGAPVGGTEDKPGPPLKVRSGDVRGALEFASTIVGQRGFFEAAPRGIAFSDRFVRLGDDGLIEPTGHHADNRARYGYGFPWSDDAACPKWLDLLRGYFADDEDAGQKVALVQEFAGVSLLGLAPRLQRALVFVGDGGTGKSTVMDVLCGCFPERSVVAIPPQSWANEYRLAMLAGKLLNACNELPEAEIIHSEPVKATITGDATTARHIREAPFTFRPVAGHLFAANTLPGTNDQTRGFWRRFLVVEFNHLIAESEMRPDVSREILASEKPGIVTWLLQGAARALQAGSYTTPASCADAIQKWRQAADQVSAFVEELCEPAGSQDASDGVAPLSLYSAYTRWANASGHRPVATNKFSVRLKALGYEQLRSKAGRWYPLRVRPVPLHRRAPVTGGDR